MSHFSVLVITPEKPTDADLQKTLQPFHEYECTGVDDEYVIDVDVTDEALKAWAEPQKAVRLADGTIVSRYDDSLYHPIGEMDEIKRPKKEFRLPDGAEEIEIPQSEMSSIEGETMEKWAEDYGGWFSREGRWYRHTNPNKKWDWWQVGGRYSGKFAPDYDPNEDPANRQICRLCQGTGTRMDMKVANGCNGCSGTGIETKWPSTWRNHGNQISVEDFYARIDALLNANRQTKAKIWDESAAKYAKRSVANLSFEEARKAWLGVLERARDARGDRPLYRAIDEQPGGTDLRAASFEWDGLPDEFLTREAFIASAVPFSCFAILHEGKWMEKGEMGWFACVSNEKDDGEWRQEIVDVIRASPKTAWLTVVDCHI